MMTVDELIIFVRADARAIPRFDTQKRGIFSVWCPEGDGFKAGIGHHNAPAGFFVEQRNLTGFDFIKVNSVVFKQFIGQGQCLCVVQT